MVMSVTRGSGRARLVAGHRAFMSHVLTKVVGDTISASWDVTNTGETAGLVLLDIFLPVLGTGWTGDTVSVAPGQTLKLTVSGVISTLVPGTSYAGQLRVRAFAPATVAPGGIHDFVVTITEPVVNTVLTVTSPTLG